MNSKFLAIFLSLFSAFLIFNFSLADVDDEVSERQRQIEGLEKQIQEYQGQIVEKQKQARTLEGEVFTLDTRIKQIRLEIQSLNLSIEQTQYEINQTIGKIDEATQKISTLKESIAEFVRLIDNTDQESLLAVLLKNASLSDFFGNLENMRTAQRKAQISIENMRDLKKELEVRQEELEEKRGELLGLRGIQEVQKQELDSKRAERNSILSQTRGEEKRYQELVKKTQFDIQRIKEQVHFLLQHGISVEDAIKFAQLAAIRVGIRPAFLLAILDVESSLGRNVGSGNWQDDLYSCYIRLGKFTRAEAEKAAILSITSRLGLDPDTVRVSAQPNYGCGGAMGPAQFLPSTWLLYEEEVARITGHNPPNPWNIEDAFMAAAVKLAAAGATAQTKTAETRAANIYLSGKSNCTQSICRYYSSLVLRKADEIERGLTM